MENKTRISIIVPVYNVANYLEDCLKSISNQTYDNLEIILVDDGSTDASPKICDAFAAKDVRIKVSHQENCGVAMTRRNAVIQASGDYICFVDADDKIDEGMIEFLYQNIGMCDAITCGCYCEEEFGKYLEQTDLIEEGVYDDEKSMRYIIANMLMYKEQFEYGLLPYLFNKMFRGNLLKEVMSKMNSTLSYAEDGEVLFQYILRCRAVCVTHKCLYYYRYRSNSALHKVNKNYMSDLNRIYISLENIFTAHPQKDILLRQLQLFVVAHIYAIPRYMGFSVDMQIAKYVFPFADLEAGSKIILYGAGRVGIDYYRQIFRKNRVELILWVDKYWEKHKEDFLPVSAPDDIRNYKYDYIVIAVNSKELANEIKIELLEKDIAKEKILWRIPAVL